MKQRQNGIKMHVKPDIDSPSDGMLTFNIITDTDILS